MLRICSRKRWTKKKATDKTLSELATSVINLEAEQEQAEAA
jgi:hypothetical protein